MSNEIKTRPLTPTEQKYTYAQSMQLEGQTGTIGHLRGDFATTGYGFYTTWFDTRPQWKSDEFKADLDTVINALREDLFLPYKEQTKRVQPGEECLAALYIDKSSRLCATMKVYEYLKKDSPYQRDDKVTGRIYEISENFGVFVAVDDCYSGLIPAKEAQGKYRVGDILNLRVTRVQEDGKLDLSDKEKIPQQMEKDAEAVMKVIEEFEGVLPFNDKVSPEIIKREFGLSKNAFKRAVGRLLKQGRIEITENRIIKR